MKHKTAELEGAALDEAVALALGLTTSLRNGNTGRPLYRVPDFIDCPSEDRDYGDDFAPSTRWDHGGPIIDRERIVPIPNDPDCKQWIAFVGGYMSHDYVVGDHHGIGPTPLIAAMRAFVASKLGEEVELP